MNSSKSSDYMPLSIVSPSIISPFNSTLLISECASLAYIQKSVIPSTRHMIWMLSLVKHLCCAFYEKTQTTPLKTWLCWCNPEVLCEAANNTCFYHPRKQSWSSIKENWGTCFLYLYIDSKWNCTSRYEIHCEQAEQKGQVKALCWEKSVIFTLRYRRSSILVFTDDKMTQFLQQISDHNIHGIWSNHEATHNHRFSG